MNRVKSDSASEGTENHSHGMGRQSEPTDCMSSEEMVRMIHDRYAAVNIIVIDICRHATTAMRYERHTDAIRAMDAIIRKADIGKQYISEIERLARRIEGACP